MYKQNIYTIESNLPLTSDVYKMVLLGDTSYITAPGTFINIKIDDLFLRRPISVCDYDDISITIIYKVVGKGTLSLSKKQKGEKLDILTGLGNGFDGSLSGDKPLLLGGGVGVPPLYNLAKKLIAEKKEVTVILGFNKKEEIFYAKEFEDLGAKVILTTVDGSVGIKGFVLPFELSLTKQFLPVPIRSNLPAFLSAESTNFLFSGLKYCSNARCCAFSSAVLGT